jgi:flagellar export protein FliJ
MKDVWTVMLDKTERQVKQAQKVLITMNGRKHEADETLVRLEKLVQEYLENMALAQKETSRLSVTQNYQQFIAEIQQAQKSVERDLMMIEVDLQVARLSVRDAEQAHMKSKKLLERQEARSLNLAMQREAKELDLHSSMRFHLQNR